MIVDFDPVTDVVNRTKHGVSLAFGARVFGDRGIAIVQTVRIGDEEERFKTIGLIEGRLWSVVHV